MKARYHHSKEKREIEKWKRKEKMRKRVRRLRKSGE